MLVLCFVVAVGQRFCFIFRRFAPEHALRIFFTSGLFFWGVHSVCHVVRVDDVRLYFLVQILQERLLRQREGQRLKLNPLNPKPIVPTLRGANPRLDPL